MDQDALYDQALSLMEGAVHTLASRVPPPQRIPFMDTFAFRYLEKTIEQAIVQKLARAVSTIRAARILMELGYVQEQGALHRILDEIGEDVLFLSLAIINNDLTTNHHSFLEYFYQEEFDGPSAMESSQKRPTVPRDKVRAYINKDRGAALDPFRGQRAMRSITKAYSGYVHVASPHVMDMYGGWPPRFAMAGMRGTSRQDEHRQDLWNCFYRGIVNCAAGAKAIGHEELFLKLRAYADDFEHQRQTP